MAQLQGDPRRALDLVRQRAHQNLQRQALERVQRSFGGQPHSNFLQLLHPGHGGLNAPELNAMGMHDQAASLWEQRHPGAMAGRGGHIPGFVMEHMEDQLQGAHPGFHPSGPVINYPGEPKALNPAGTGVGAPPFPHGQAPTPTINYPGEPSVLNPAGTGRGAPPPPAPTPTINYPGEPSVLNPAGTGVGASPALHPGIPADVAHGFRAPGPFRGGFPQGDFRGHLPFPGQGSVVPRLPERPIGFPHPGITPQLPGGLVHIGQGLFFHPGTGQIHGFGPGGPVSGFGGAPTPSPATAVHPGVAV